MLIEYMLSAQSLCELPIPQPECDRIVIGGDVEEEEGSCRLVLRFL